MDTAHNDAPPARSIEPEPKPDLFSSLCCLASFVTNSKRVLKITRDLAPAEVSVLCSLLLACGVEISQLTLKTTLPPGTAVQLGSAIKCLSTISLDYDSVRNIESAVELLRILNLVPALGQPDLHLANDNRETCGSFEKFAALRSLTIIDHSVNPIPWLVSRIGQFRALESLRISNVYISDSDAEILLATLGERLPLLAELNISRCGRWKKIGRQIGSLVALGRIKKLILRRNLLEDEGVSAMVDTILAPGIRTCKLQQLGLPINDIREAGGIKLAELIAHSPYLRVLDLNDNCMGEIAAEALFKAIKLRAQLLEELDIIRCDLGSRGPLLFLGALREFTALRVLKTGWSNVRDLGAHALSQFLQSSGGCRLVELQLERSNIRETRALELAGAITKAYALQNIIMSGNSIGARGGAAIFDALATAYMVPMDTIDFSCCNIGDDGASAAGRLILHRGCRRVLLSYTEMHAAGAKAIVDSVAISACTISFLDLSGNPIGDEGVKYVFDKMVQSRRRFVHKLNIEGTEMAAEAALAVKLAVETYVLPYRILVDSLCSPAASIILEEVMTWERDSKPSRTAILRLKDDF